MSVEVGEYRLDCAIYRNRICSLAFVYMISLYFCTHSSSKLAKDNESDTFRMRIQRIQH